MSAPEIVRHGLCAMQVCVPADFTDEQVSQFANSECPTGIASQWAIRKQGHECLAGCDERVRCEARDGFVHIMLEC